MADRNILTVSEAEITEGSFLFAEVNEQLVKVPVDSLPTGGGESSGPEGSNYVFVDEEPDNPDVVPDEIRTPELNADMLGGKRPDEYTMRLQNKFSYDEKVIGEWIDGKPLYRKYIGFPVSDAERTSDSHYKYVVNFNDPIEHIHADIGNSFWYRASENANSARTFYSIMFTTYTSGIYIDIDSTRKACTIIWTGAEDFINYKILFLLVYTKGAD